MEIKQQSQEQDLAKHVENLSVALRIQQLMSKTLLDQVQSLRSLVDVVNELHKDMHYLLHALVFDVLKVDEKQLFDAANARKSKDFDASIEKLAQTEGLVDASMVENNSVVVLNIKNLSTGKDPVKSVVRINDETLKQKELSFVADILGKSVGTTVLSKSGDADIEVSILRVLLKDATVNQSTTQTTTAAEQIKH